MIKANCLEAALNYANRGWAIVPLLEGGKRPLLSPNIEFATTDAALIKGYFAKKPHLNFGLVTDPYCCIDLDVFKILKESGEVGLVDGIANWQKLCSEHNTPLTLTHQSMTGQHVFFRGDLPSKTNRETGISWFGVGWYMVAPPSIVQGVQYKVLQDLPIAPLPDWLKDIANDAHNAYMRSSRGVESPA